VIVLDDALVLMEKGQEGGEGKREGAEEPKAEDEALDALIEEEEGEEETVESPPVLQQQQLEAKEGEELEEEEEEKEGELDEEEEKKEEEEIQRPQQLISRAATPSPSPTSRPPSPITTSPAAHAEETKADEDYLESPPSFFPAFKKAVRVLLFPFEVAEGIWGGIVSVAKKGKEVCLALGRAAKRCASGVHSLACAGAIWAAQVLAAQLF